MQPEPEGSEPDEAGAGGEDTDKEGDAASDAPAPRARPYVHLACVHCKEKCRTFAVSIELLPHNFKMLQSVIVAIWEFKL